MPILVWYLSCNNIEKNLMFSPFCKKLFTSLQIISDYALQLGISCSDHLQDKTTQVGTSFWVKTCCRSQMWEHRFKSSANTKWLCLPHKLGQPSPSTVCLGFVFLLWLWVLCTYFNSWVALGSEAPQPHSDACFSVSHRNSRSHLQMKEKQIPFFPLLI